MCRVAAYATERRHWRAVQPTASGTPCVCRLLSMAYGLMGLMGVMQGVPMVVHGGGNDVLLLTERPDRELPS